VKLKQGELLLKDIKAEAFDSIRHQVGLVDGMIEAMVALAVDRDNLRKDLDNAIRKVSEISAGKKGDDGSCGGGGGVGDRVGGCDDPGEEV